MFGKWFLGPFIIPTWYLGFVKNNIEVLISNCLGLVVLWKSLAAEATCFASAKRVDHISAKSVAIRRTPTIPTVKVVVGGGYWWGCPDASQLVPIEGTVIKIWWGAFPRSVCIRIADYAKARCRVTNAFKKRLTESVTMFEGKLPQVGLALLLLVIWSGPILLLLYICVSEGRFGGPFDAVTITVHWTLYFRCLCND